MRIPYFLIRWYYAIIDFIRYRILWPGNMPLREKKTKKEFEKRESERNKGLRILHVLWVFVALIFAFSIFILFTHFPEVIGGFLE